MQGDPLLFWSNVSYLCEMWINTNLFLSWILFLTFDFFGCPIDLSCSSLLCFQRVFGVPSLEKTAHDDYRKLASAIYLQVSTISQALIFVTRSRGWSYVERHIFMADSCIKVKIVEFDEISEKCIFSCSLSAYLIVGELMSPISCCVLGDQCEMLSKFHQI